MHKDYNFVTSLPTLIFWFFDTTILMDMTCSLTLRTSM